MPAERERKGRGSYLQRRKVCKLCLDRVGAVDFHEVRLIQKFVTELGKIMPSRISGTCAHHQRQLARAIKRARLVALMPYVGE